MIINNYIFIRFKQGYRLLLEIGILRFIIIAIFFITPFLLLFNKLVHTNAQDKYLNFISGEYLSGLILIYVFVKINNSFFKLNGFLETINSQKHIFQIKALNSFIVWFPFILFTIFPYCNVKILVLILILCILNIINSKAIFFKTTFLTFFSTPLLDLNRYLRNYSNILILVFMYTIIYIGLKVKNENLTMVFEFLLITNFMSLFTHSQEPLYYLLQYNGSFNLFFTNKIKTIYKYVSIFYLPLILLLFLSNSKVYSYFPFLVFYVLLPFLLYIKYATYPNVVLNIIIQSFYLGFTFYIASLPFLFFIWLAFTIFIIKKAYKNFNQLFYVTYPKPQQALR